MKVFEIVGGAGAGDGTGKVAGFDDVGVLVWMKGTAGSDSSAMSLIGFWDSFSSATFMPDSDSFVVAILVFVPGIMLSCSSKGGAGTATHSTVELLLR